MLKITSKMVELNGLTVKDLEKKGFKKINKKDEKDFIDRFGIKEGTTNIYAYRNKWDFECAYGVEVGEEDLVVVL